MFERSPTATIKVKKAEKSLLDVSNSSAATDGSVKKLLQFFLVFQQHSVSLRIILFTDPKLQTLCYIPPCPRPWSNILSLQFFKSRILSHDFCHTHHSKLCQVVRMLILCGILLLCCWVLTWCGTGQLVGPLDAFTGGGMNLGRVERGSVGGTWHDLTNKRWLKKRKMQM